MTERTLYAVRLGDGALARGERVSCEVLEWLGKGEALARVRILHSTLDDARYRTGRIGIMRGDRLVARRTERAGHVA